MVPTLAGLTTEKGRMETYNCDSLTRYGDRLNFKFVNNENSIDVKVANLNCDELVSKLKENNWNITAWLDLKAYSPIAYIIQIDDLKLQTQNIGTSIREINFIAIFMIILGIYCGIKAKRIKGVGDT